MKQDETDSRINDFHSFSSKYSIGLNVLVFFLLVIAIFLNSLTFPTGYITLDSSKYLKAAGAIAEGKDLRIMPPEPGKEDAGYFKRWPAGYPVFIAGIKKISGLDLFLSSKVANVLAAGMLILAFYFFFGNYSWVFSLSLLNPTFTEIFSYSWSETLFLPLWIMAFLSLNTLLFRPDFAPLNRKLTNNFLALNYSILIFSLALIPFTRYIGFILYLFLGGSLWYYRKEAGKRKFGVILGGVIALIISLFTVLPELSKMATNIGGGGITHSNNFPGAGEVIWTLLKEAIIPGGPEINNFGIWVILFLTQGGIFTLFLWKLKGKRITVVSAGQSLKNLFFGSAFYLLTLIVMIILLAFGPFRFHVTWDFRLISPAVLLFYCSILILVIRQHGEFQATLVKIFVVLFLLGYLINVPGKYIRNNIRYGEKGYYFYEKEIRNEFSFLDDETEPVLILNGPYHLNYLFPSAIVMKLKNHSDVESLKAFKGKIFLYTEKGPIKRVK